MSDQHRKSPHTDVEDPSGSPRPDAPLDGTAATAVGPLNTIPGAASMETAPYASDGAQEHIPDLKGALIGNLALTTRIGTGAMGSVYRARHRTLGTAYAVKVLHPRFAADEAALERFKFEAIACSRLRHENVVFVTDFGFQQGVGLYITMELLEGQSLRSLLEQEGPLSLSRAARIVDQVCAGISAAHRLAIVHRDLKPDNIVILADPTRRDFAKVLDFGIAKMKRHGDQPLTHEGLIIGTASYMAPEQLKADVDVGPTSDIYALGCILYELIIGTPPFGWGSEFEVMASHLNDLAPRLGQHRAELKGTGLEELVARMLSKEAGQRPASMDDVRQDLAKALEALQVAGIKGTTYPAELGHIRAEPREQPTSSVGHTIERIRRVGPSSPAALLIGALRSTNALPGDTLCHALWGVISLELLEQSEHSPRFAVAAEQATLLYQLVLQNQSGERAEAFRRVAFSALARILSQMKPKRRRRFNKALLPLCGHPLFPKELIPAETSGTWQIFEPPPSDTPENTDKSASLLQKLSQDASMANLKAVLGHEIRLFGSKKQPASPPERDTDQDGVEDADTDR